MESSRKNENISARWLIGIAKAQFVFLAAGAVLLTIFCWIAWQLEDPESITRPLSLVALCLSSLVGGIGAVRFTGDGLLSGFISGTVSLMMIRLLAMLPLPTSGTEMGQMIVFCCLIPALSVCGAILGKKRRKNTRRKHR